MKFLLPVLVCGLLAGPLPALAHPHVFIDTALEVIFDDMGQATALRIRWTYDDFYSLTLISERGLDADFDGALTAQEAAALNGFDMNWDPGFAGDTYALIGDQTLVLSAPSDWTSDYVDGRVISTHLRRFDPPVVIGDQPLVIQVYDPSYYTAYRIAAKPTLIGRADCTAKVFVPDPAKVDETLKAALAEYSGTEDVEADYPAVGAQFAEEARITCAKP